MRGKTLTGWALMLLLLATAVSAEEKEPTTEPSEPNHVEEEARGSFLPTRSELQEFTLARPRTSVSVEDSRDSSLFQFSGVGMLAASAADLATTEWGLSQGLREGNPIASGRELRITHHVVGPLAVWWTTERLRRSGKPKLATVLRIGLMVAYGYAAMHNVRQVQSLSPGSP